MGRKILKPSDGVYLQRRETLMQILMARGVRVVRKTGLYI